MPVERSIQPIGPTEYPLNFDAPNIPELGKLQEQLTIYVDRIADLIPTSANKDRLVEEASELIKENNIAAKIASSPGFEHTISEKKVLRGPTSITFTICPDGRNNTKMIVGARGNKQWETLAGIPQITEDEERQAKIRSEALSEAIEKKAIKGGDILHFSLGHFSASDSDRGCGAMGLKKKNGELPEGTEDLALANIDLLRESAKVFANQFNRETHRYGKERIQQAVITGLIDTDTLGLVFNYGTPNELKVTDLTQELLTDIPTVLPNEKPFNQPGQLKDYFNNPRCLISIENYVLHVAKNILNKENGLFKFSKVVDDYIANCYPRLTKEQQKAFKFVIAYNIASQYLGGFYQGEHEFTDHNESFQTLSFDGIGVGRHMYDTQVFASNPSSADEAVSNTAIKSMIMDKNPHSKRPHILFLALAEGSKNVAKMHEAVMSPDFAQLIEDGVIFPIPVIVKRKTGEILEIPQNKL